MKNSLLALVLILGIVLVSFHSAPPDSKEPIIQSKTVTQVAIVVKDIDKASKAWAHALGVEVPVSSIAEGHSSRPTLYKGSPTDAKAKLAFLEMDNLQIELIQPLGGQSTWQDYMDRNGEGIHHIAFQVKDIDGMEKKFMVNGNPTIQRGGWDGGAYSYIDASTDLGCILEILENYR